MPARLSTRLWSAPWSVLVLAVPMLASAPAWAQEDGDDEPESRFSTGTLGDLKLRSLGPALMSGRIGDFAVDPNNPARYFVAVSSGNVWKTENAGTTYEPVFDSYGSYSIGCVELDPNNPNVVWVGTGENNSQRSVSLGDGVYKSLDGGVTFTNMGLEDSEHIGTIAIDPRDSDVVYVAAQGPLWNAGGDRGLYKTTDGGATWELVLEISENTGINEVHLDPRDPDVVYASAYQRRRHTWTLINGGPESGLHKSTDGGATWREINTGLPSVDKGRIGMDISPANPDVLYAIVEAADGKGGVFRSIDRGERWEKRNDYMTTSGQYYNEVIACPHDVDRAFFVDTYFRVTRDGGKTIERMPHANMHVDMHAIWIDPVHPDHLLVGNDGGIYQTWDGGAHWRYQANLPITQFYRLAIDNREPFYYVYGGTQDNNTQGGPVRTTDVVGITNEDWFITVGGDGFEAAVDPTNPDIVYSQWQYGGLVRYDHASGETVDIKPREKPGEEPYVWNWDAPLIISPHNPRRLYYAADRLFRSDDRGDSWTAVSGDLTRDIDRNTLEVMGEIQKPDAVAKANSTSIYGNCVSLTESPLAEGLIYVGTDDGLVHVSEDGGGNWRTIDRVGDVPEFTYVTWLRASVHDADRVYAAFDNHKQGDFLPHVYRSDDRGRTWTNIAGDLPERGYAHCVVEDHVDPNLLFCGTEFAAFATVNGGEEWVKLPGMPTIAVEDMEIQQRENDLVIATFGRGFYVLDDYSALRSIDEDVLESNEAMLFTPRDAWWYVERNRLGDHNGKGTQGASYYAASNPPFGAVFTYYLREGFQTVKEVRHEREKEEDWMYPSLDDFKAERRAREPSVYLTIRDSAGDVVRRVDAKRTKGMHRTAWDLRVPAPNPVNLNYGGPESPWSWVPEGHLALPGTYSATLHLEREGEIRQLAGPVEFDVVPLGNATLAAGDKASVFAFQSKAAELARAVEGALRVAREGENRLRHLRRAAIDTRGIEDGMLAEVVAVQDQLEDVLIELRGDPTYGQRDLPQSPSISGRVWTVVSGLWHVTSPPTGTQREQYAIAAADFERVLGQLRALLERDLAGLEMKLEAAGAPWTPGRVPNWRR